uniref:WH2 domain-containing protein n=1 Tax=Globodera rostochiensis TaxID=31243 RepID=A0A914I506_GLORO
MAFVGHPVLADIRKGFRLRPTQTVDKSKPIIQAEGEQLPDLLHNPSPSPAPAPPQAQSNGTPRAAPAPPPPPPMPAAKDTKRQLKKTAQTQKSAGGQPMNADQRQKLLAQIRAGGVSLRRVHTADKSGLILDEQQQRALGTRNGAASPQSLDSQGKSPSPRTTPSSSSASALSPTPISADNSGCCQRTLSDDSSDFMLMMNGCVQQNHYHLHSDHQHYLPDHQHNCPGHDLHQQQPPQHCTPPTLTFLSPSDMVIGRMPSPTTSPAKCHQATTIIRVNGTAGRRDSYSEDQQQPKPKSDFQFDEQKQVLDRQGEVATLCAQRSASAKIVAFRKLQQRHQQQTESAAAYCTLPRKARAQTPQQHWHASMSSPQNGGGTLPSMRSPRALPTLAGGTATGHSIHSRRAQSPSDWHGTKWPPATTTKIAVNCSKPPSNTQQQRLQNPFNQQQNANIVPTPNLRWRSPSPQAQDDARPMLQRSASSSMAQFAPAELSAPAQSSATFRPFGQRVTGGGAHRQHFERIRGSFEDAEKKNGAAERNAAVLWKRAAQERKSAGEVGANPGTNGGVATIFVNGGHLSRFSVGIGQPQKAQPPPLPTSSPPELRQKMRPFTSSPSPSPSREVIRLKTPTNGVDLRDLQGLDGAQLAALRADFKFAIDLDGDGNGKRLIRIVRR